MKKIIFWGGFLVVCFSLFSGTSYVAWNTIDPEFTCAQCHEVKPAHFLWKKSAHANVVCYDCHGTAISNGLHSLKEKANMVFSHFSKDIKNRDIKLTEAQVLDISNRCGNCHQEETARWRSGAHSTKYANIFEDKVHNKMEKPYADCFRCHGMFYDGNISKLMTLEGECNAWKIKDTAQAQCYAIPCMACHQVHTEKEKSPVFQSRLTNKTKIQDCPKTSFYLRAEKQHLRTDKLTPIQMYLDGKPIETSKDANNTLCVQCHSPDWRRNAQTLDDRTPTGAHKGFSCIVCHDPHSNSASNSCIKCHSDKKYTPAKDARCNW